MSVWSVSSCPGCPKRLSHQWNVATKPSRQSCFVSWKRGVAPKGGKCRRRENGYVSAASRALTKHYVSLRGKAITRDYRAQCYREKVSCCIIHVVCLRRGEILLAVACSFQVEWETNNLHNLKPSCDGRWNTIWEWAPFPHVAWELQFLHNLCLKKACTYETVELKLCFDYSRCSTKGVDVCTE